MVCTGLDAFLRLFNTSCFLFLCPCLRPPEACWFSSPEEPVARCSRHRVWWLAEKPLGLVAYGKATGPFVLNVLIGIPCNSNFYPKFPSHDAHDGVQKADLSQPRC